MEGRAIARPNPLRQLPPGVRRLASMEGRAIARPNRLDRLIEAAGVIASMEGRAIARPNGAGGSASAKWKNWLQWRAEQLPGQTRSRLDSSCGPMRSLHWRAEQCPATGRVAVNVAGLGRASMEGRAIARPNT